MIGSDKVTVVMPAYNAEQTLKRTVEALDRSVVDDIILVDDKSQDHTVDVAKQLGLFMYQHDRNRGYGGNPGKCRPQLDNLAQDLSSLRSTVNVIQLLLCELEGLVL